MKPNKIKLITWNIRWGRGIDNVVDLSRIVSDAKKFADFDIFCVQEVASGYSASELQNSDVSNQFEILAQKLPEYTPIRGYAIDQLGPGKIRQQFGNMIFSRFPVLQIYRHRLPWPAEPGVKSMQRMALETLLDTPLGIISVITTHLEFYSAYQRMAQVKYLRQIHQESYKHAFIADETASKGPFSPYPKISGRMLAGDFNFGQESDERKYLLSAIDSLTLPLMDAWEIAHPGQKHAPTMGYFDRNRWPDGPFVSDYIFVSNELVTSVQDLRIETKTCASDHQPVLLELA